MSFKMTVSEKDVYGHKKFVNAKNNTECVEFVRQTTGAPPTQYWKQGAHVQGSKPGTIEPYTAIATFDSSHKYPTDDAGKHAAI